MWVYKFYMCKFGTKIFNAKIFVGNNTTNTQKKRDIFLKG